MGILSPGFSNRGAPASLILELGAGLQAPLSAMLGAMNGVLMTFAGALDALKTQREGA